MPKKDNSFGSTDVLGKCIKIISILSCLARKDRGLYHHGDEIAVIMKKKLNDTTETYTIVATTSISNIMIYRRSIS